MDGKSDIATGADAGTPCPEWCDGVHPHPSTFHYGSVLMLTAPSNDEQSERPLLKFALMGDTDAAVSHSVLPMVDVEGITDQELEEASLDALISQFEQFLVELRGFQRRHAEIAQAARRA